MFSIGNKSLLYLIVSNISYLNKTHKSIIFVNGGNHVFQTVVFSIYSLCVPGVPSDPHCIFLLTSL